MRVCEKAQAKHRCMGGLANARCLTLKPPTHFSSTTCEVGPPLIRFFEKIFLWVKGDAPIGRVVQIGLNKIRNRIESIVIVFKELGMNMNYVEPYRKNDLILI